MENKKMPFAVFVLKYVENVIADYKKDGLNEFDVLEELVSECDFCPLYKECGRRNWAGCKTRIRENVESAE